MFARGADIINIIISVIIFNKNDTGIIENIIFLLLLFGMLTSLLIAIGKENVAIVMNKPNVGITSEYSPIPSTPICLVIIIFKMNPKNFDRNPPVSSISVPVMNLFFIISFIIFNIMKSIRFID